ncbi:unnamed protein product [Rhizoctonia solani]|uniref:adenosine deaminase n=1 Tax=Rhizoctonia solani TaxID=456999 RepID=A0A8H2WCR4_9AGAM|nr:unnamed protein product [Rhizoctonia solani]
MGGIDSDINEYARRRASLITAEQTLRFDAKAIASATENERFATEIVNDLREREAKEIWEAGEGMFVRPGMRFLATKDIIMNTELYQTIRKLPKGGLLRGHMNNMCDVGFIYRLALEYPAIHIRVNSRIIPNAPLPLPELKPLAPKLALEYTNTPSLTSADYIPGTWLSLGKARDGYSYGGPEAFDEWILGLLSLSADEPAKDYAMLAKTRKKFRGCYHLVRGIVCYEPALKRFFRRILMSLIEDGVCYAEIRGNFSYKMDVWENGSETLSHRDYLVLFDQAVQEVKRKMKLEGREDEFIGAKLIYCVYRTFTKRKLQWYLNDCIALKTEFPGLIAGFDFLGPERQGNLLSYYLEPLMWFRKETSRRGLDIPFLFLAGAPVSNEEKAESNLYDAILLGTKRIGHGLDLAKHPLLVQMVKEQGAAVEVCLISNEIMGFTPLLHHPLTTLIGYGVPVVLCPDNPGTYGYTGLSPEFFQAMVCSTKSNLLSLKQLAEQSLQYSCLNKEEMKIAYEAWERRWYNFVDGLVGGRLESKH